MIMLLIADLSVLTAQAYFWPPNQMRMRMKVPFLFLTVYFIFFISQETWEKSLETSPRLPLTETFLAFTVHLTATTKESLVRQISLKSTKAPTIVWNLNPVLSQHRPHFAYIFFIK